MRWLYGILAFAALGAATPAKAVILGNAGFDWNIAGASILTLSPVVPGGNQPRNLPCIICGANQPQQPANFGYNLFGNQGNASTLPYFSTATVGGSLAPDQLGTGYSLAAGSPFLTALAGRTDFSIGIDVNDTNKAQVLESFWFLNLTQHSVLAVYSPDPNDGTPILAPNNGTGFPDWTLTGFNIQRGDILPGDQIIFFARITGANDGPDSFFLVPGPNVAETPLPPAVALFGSVIAGGVGLSAIRNRRRKRVA